MTKYFALLGILLLSACGYHLRDLDNPQHPRIEHIKLHIDEDISISLKQLITRQLAKHNIHIDDTAAYTLHISNANAEKRRVSTSPNAYHDRYLLRFSVQSTLQYNDTQWPINAYAERLFEENKNTPSAKSREESLIRDELERDVINQVINQLYAYPDTMVQ